MHHKSPKDYIESTNFFHVELMNLKDVIAGVIMASWLVLTSTHKPTAPRYQQT